MFDMFRPTMAEVAVAENLIRPFDGVKEAIDQLQANGIQVGCDTGYPVEAYNAMLECFGAAGVIPADAPGAILRGRVESSYRNTLILTFGGGTNEVQRDIIAMTALGLPHYKN